MHLSHLVTPILTANVRPFDDNLFKTTYKFWNSVATHTIHFKMFSYYGLETAVIYAQVLFQFLQGDWMILRIMAHELCSLLS